MKSKSEGPITDDNESDFDWILLSSYLDSFFMVFLIIKLQSEAQVEMIMNRILIGFC